MTGGFAVDSEIQIGQRTPLLEMGAAFFLSWGHGWAGGARAKKRGADGPTRPPLFLSLYLYSPPRNFLAFLAKK